MSDDKHKPKDWWDRISAITPLILGICITGGGAYLGAWHNHRQDKLAEISALEKYQPLLTSSDSAKREFGYASFAALGYQELALRIVHLTQDAAAKPVVEGIKSANPELAARADQALKELSSSERFVNKYEFGSEEGLQGVLKQAADFALTKGLKSEIGTTILYDTLTQQGLNQTNKFSSQATEACHGDPQTGIPEKKWLSEFLKARRSSVATKPDYISSAVNSRIDALSKKLDELQ